MFGTISNDLQKLINDLRKLVLFFTQAHQAASAGMSRRGWSSPRVAKERHWGGVNAALRYRQLGDAPGVDEATKPWQQMRNSTT